MTLASDILRNGAGSPTAKIAAVSGSGSASYTATGPTMITIIAAYNSTLIIDGVAMTPASPGSQPYIYSYYLGNGQSTTVSTGAAGFHMSARKVD